MCVLKYSKKKRQITSKNKTSLFLINKKKRHNISFRHSSIMDTNRLSKELREIASDKASGVSVELVGDSLAHMRGTITGTNHLSLRVF